MNTDAFQHLTLKIRGALRAIQDADSALRADALNALDALAAIIEVQGVRIDQLMMLIPLDERGYPVTQELVDELYQRPRRNQDPAP